MQAVYINLYPTLSAWRSHIADAQRKSSIKCKTIKENRNSQLAFASNFSNKLFLTLYKEWQWLIPPTLIRPH